MPFTYRYQLIYALVGRTGKLYKNQEYRRRVVDSDHAGPCHPLYSVRIKQQPRIFSQSLAVRALKIRAELAQNADDRRLWNSVFKHQ